MITMLGPEKKFRIVVNKEPCMKITKWKFALYLSNKSWRRREGTKSRYSVVQLLTGLSDFIPCMPKDDQMQLKYFLVCVSVCVNNVHMSSWFAIKKLVKNMESGLLERLLLSVLTYVQSIHAKHSLVS